MREYLKELRKMESEKLIERLNYNQREYNKRFDIYRIDRRDSINNYFLDLFKTNMDKIKKVFKERNIEIDFINGWEMI